MTLGGKGGDFVPTVYDQDELGSVFGVKSKEYKTAIRRNLNHFVYTYLRHSVENFSGVGAKSWLVSEREYATLGTIENGEFIAAVRPEELREAD